MNLRMRCESITHHAMGMHVDVVFRPVGNEGNEDWIRNRGFPVSSSAELRLTIGNHEAFGAFTPGVMYDFAVTPAAQP